jgi:hypothetical protein
MKPEPATSTSAQSPQLDLLSWQPPMNANALSLGSSSISWPDGFKKTTCLYVFKARSRPDAPLVKIGLSRRPWERLTQVRSIVLRPMQIVFLAGMSFDDARAKERECHRLLEAHRAQRLEWFKIPAKEAVTTLTHCLRDISWHDVTECTPSGPLEPTDLGALIASRGSVRRVAMAIGEPYGTLRKWVEGLRTPHPQRLAEVRERIERLVKLRPAPRGRAAQALRRA